MKLNFQKCGFVYCYSQRDIILSVKSSESLFDSICRHFGFPEDVLKMTLESDRSHERKRVCPGIQHSIESFGLKQFLTSGYFVHVLLLSIIR